MSSKGKVAFLLLMAILAASGCARQPRSYPGSGLPRVAKLSWKDLSVSKLKLQDTVKTLLKLHPDIQLGTENVNISGRFSGLHSTGLITVELVQGKLDTIYGYSLEAFGKEVAHENQDVSVVETFLGSPNRVTQEDKTPDHLDSWHYDDLGLTVFVSSDGKLSAGFFLKPVR